MFLADGAVAAAEVKMMVAAAAETVENAAVDDVADTAAELVL